MVFASLFFVFLFFPLCLILHSIMPGLRAKNIVLLIFSLIFYLWSGPTFLIILIGDTLACYIFTMLMAKQKKRSKKKLYLSLAITSMLIVLGFFKYAMLLLSGYNLIATKLFGAVGVNIPNIVLPIGISFYTFQLISYAVDVYRNPSLVQKNFFTLLLYSSLFHQCIAGPIIRYDQIAAEVDDRKLCIDDVFNGILRFSIGLAKKAVLANACAAVADSFLPEAVVYTQTQLGVFIGLVAYMLQIYLDFSAYSDMAIGMGLMMGFHLPENFDHPYVSVSITEFWRRWHITLGSFFRDYVYIPLGGNRKGNVRTFFNLLVVWALTGLWHGAHTNFILWGLYFFIFIALEKYVFKKIGKKIPYVIKLIYTLIVVLLGWLLFYYNSFDLIVAAATSLFTKANGFTNISTNIIIKNNIFLLIFSAVACTPLYSKVRTYLYDSAAAKKHASPYLIMADTAISIICIILSLLALIGNSYNPFLYFQF